MSIISAGTTTTTALVETGDTTGNLVLQVNGTTPSLTLNTTQALGVGSSPAYGTSGQVLTSAGSAASPTWSTPSSGAMSLISTQTASSSTSLQWTGLSGYNSYQLIIKNLQNAGYGFYIQFGTGGTPTWVTSGYYHSSMAVRSDGGGPYLYGQSSATGILFFYYAGTVQAWTASGDTVGQFIIGNINQNYCTVAGFDSALNIAGSQVSEQMGGGTSGGPVTAIRILSTSGTITSGTASLYGISS